MVATRNHPRAFPPPETPSKSDDADSVSTSRSSRSTKSRATTSPGPESPTTTVTTTAASKPRTRTRTSAAAAAAAAGTWAHTPSNTTLVWLLVSLPLVLWDVGYVLGRPATFPGGWAHAPIWTPYALYYTIDYIYGQKAYDERNGFTAAQSAVNVAETGLYLVYLYLVFARGAPQPDRRVTRSGGKAAKVQGRGAPSPRTVGWLGEARIVGGRAAGWASLIGLSASVMTLSKTVLYMFNEYYSGWANVGHNSWWTLVTMWIIPK